MYDHQTAEFNKGFTLIEVLVSAMIMVVVFVTLATVLTKSLSLSQHSRDRASANKILQSTMEYLRTKRDELGYNSFVDRTECTLAGSVPLPTASDSRYTVAVTCYPVAPTPTGSADPCLEKIKVNTVVTWEENSITGETYFSKWR